MTKLPTHVRTQQELFRLKRPSPRRRPLHKSAEAVPEEALHLTGTIKIFEYPGWTEEEVIYWTLPEVNERGEIIRPARMSPEEIEKHLAGEWHNLLTSGGRNQALQFFGNAGSTPPFSQYFSVATFPINQVSPGDITMTGEIFRKVPDVVLINSPQGSVDLQIVIGTNDAAGTWASFGLWGNGATKTIVSGTLMTHGLFTPYFTKVNGTPVTVDYGITLS